MSALPTFPDKYFDLAVVDPPYGIGVTNFNMGGRQTVRPDKQKTWDTEPPSPEYFKELFRVSKNQIIWGGNYFPLPPTRCFIVWDKGETMYGRSFAECELAWTSFDEVVRIFKISPNDKARIHVAQKPVALYEKSLIRFSEYLPDGAKILDTHVGSASSLIACWNLGHSYIGFERDPEIFKLATERLEAVKAQMRFW